MLNTAKLSVILGILALIGLALYFVYDYGYNEGVSYKQIELDDYKAQVAEANKKQNERIEKAELLLAQSASEYEKLRDNYESVLMDNQKWKDQHIESKNRSLSLQTVSRINSLLSRF